MEKLNRVIEEAPRIKAERERAQREELLLDRSTRAHHRLNSTTLADSRFDQAPSRGRRKPLKAERRQALLMSLAWLVALLVLVVWLLNVFHWQWPS